MGSVLCPLCGDRKARRPCPALGQTICSVCCATKRLTEIRCPPSCAYLTLAREHPSASTIRQRRDDTARLLQATRDLSERQSRIFLALVRFLGAYHTPELERVEDEDLVQAAGSLAATLETAARGVIYEHRPESLSAARLASAIRPVLAEVNQPAAAAFDRDAAVVLRRIEDLAKSAPDEGGNRRRAFEILARTRQRIVETGPTEPSTDEPRLIVP